LKLILKGTEGGSNCAPDEIKIGVVEGFSVPQICCAKIKEDFCGSSTKGECNSDADCVTGGCSGQICQSKSEEQLTTTCEFKECYRASDYGLSCRCINNQCIWN